MSLGHNYETFSLSPPGSSAHVDMQSQPDTQHNARRELASAGPVIVSTRNKTALLVPALDTPPDGSLG